MFIRSARLPIRLWKRSSRIASRFNTSTAKKPESASNKLELSPITSVTDGLKKYVRWYPYDTVTYSTIQSFLGYAEIQQNRRRSLWDFYMKSLLADPLASNNEKWFRPLANRSREKNNLIHLQDPDPSEFILPGPSSAR
ncbi:uncharacterized protein CXQ87_003115 [Candidozyma duobushaemuli]|uniref:Uncharacterized protein n=1 Tax=Candidozyma duobushaemuli TaxID=1231522 RepID=A0A2V1AA66_9ASCO|nr:uncharacterized protein CXQ87_003115 [[Candida] duobushaemulonis]PVH15277.1 hypothetical protein CXQ87_003115 [[Candida] duobushaemulonis]